MERHRIPAVKRIERILVLGAGLVGGEIARDLSTSFEVAVADRDPDRLARVTHGTEVTARELDLTEPSALADLLPSIDLVVGALPGALGYRAVQAAILAGKPVVDIAFFPEDPFTLDDLAVEQGVSVLVDFGVAPGMSNVFLGHHVATMKSVSSFECLVGGLPVERRWPFEYKAAWSPVDVLEEYTRPARYVANGVQVVRPALTDPELVQFEGIGTLEALNTDGLRTLLRMKGVPNMKEKTLRYPGHGRLMEALRESGFLSSEAVEVPGGSVRPIDVTATLLFPLWALEEGEQEFTVMRVTVEGEAADGENERIVWELLDRTDPTTGATSMSRTTGYACTAAVHLLAEGRFTRKGVTPPEVVGAERECFDFLLAYQAERGVVYRRA